jgi:hypothetical protein
MRLAAVSPILLWSVEITVIPSRRISFKGVSFIGNNPYVFPDFQAVQTALFDQTYQISFFNNDKSFLAADNGVAIYFMNHFVLIIVLHAEIDEPFPDFRGIRYELGINKI